MLIIKSIGTQENNETFSLTKPIHVNSVWATRFRKLALGRRASLPPADREPVTSQIRMRLR